MLKKHFKKLFLLSLTVTSMFSLKVFGNTEEKIKEFLFNYPSFFYDEYNENQLTNEIATKELGMFSQPINIEVYDVFQDGSNCIILNYKRFENYYGDVYKFSEDENEYYYVETIDSSYRFFKNTLGKIILFEGSRASDGVKYSYVYNQNSKFLKDTFYYDGNEFYNRINEGKKYDSDKLIKDPKIIDNTLVEIKPRDYSRTLETMKKQVLDENNDKNKFKLLLNEKRITPVTQPILKNDRILVPVRTIAEVFGKEVDWDDSLKKAIVLDKDKNIEFFIGKNIALVNGLEVKMDTAPIIHKGYTMLPIGFIVETLGGNVIWIDDNKTAHMDYFFETWKINGEYYSEEIEKEFKNIIEVNHDLSGKEKVIFWTNESLKDFRITRVDFESVDNEINFIDIEDIYEKEILEPNELIIINTHIPEGIPLLKVSYTDQFSNRKVLYISYDGRYGGVYFYSS